MPGMLPVLNYSCIYEAIKTGIAIKADINNKSIFDRKNYFYADLPQGYQISQFSDPIVSGGEINIAMPYGQRKIGVERIHVEQDAGKSIHDQSPSESFVDLNRSGVGLMEIVSNPDLRSAEEAGEYVKKLRQILRYVGSCDGDMEKGSLRCDANVSVRVAGEQKLGVRNEIKNLNSIRFIIAAINYEVERQIEVLESGGEIEQATRLFDTTSGITKVMRTKEDAHDYRYFPDPDLYPVFVEQKTIDEIKSLLPELPDQKKERYVSDYNLSDYDAGVISSDKSVAEFFDELVNLTKDPKKSCTWLTAELFGRLNKIGKEISQSSVSAKDLAELIELINDGSISGKIAKDVLDQMLDSGKSASVIVEENGLKQVSDSGEIESMIDKVLQENPDKVDAYKGGKDKLFGFFVGQVMKLSKGQANPKTVNEILKEKLI